MKAAHFLKNRLERVNHLPAMEGKLSAERLEACLKFSKTVVKKLEMPTGKVLCPQQPVFINVKSENGTIFRGMNQRSVIRDSEVFLKPDNLRLHVIGYVPT